MSFCLGLVAMSLEPRNQKRKKRMPLNSLVMIRALIFGVYIIAPDFWKLPAGRVIIAKGPRTRDGPSTAPGRLLPLSHVWGPELWY